MYIVACAAWCNVTPELFAKAHPNMPEGSRKGWVRVFKAIIGTMKDPSHEMLLVGARSIGKTMGVANHIERSRPCWDAMIEEKLDGI